MNKKIVVALCGLLLSGVASADNKFFIGADAGWNKFKFEDTTGTTALYNTNMKKNSPSISLVGGVQPHENFAVQVGYTFYKAIKNKADNNAWGSYKVKPRNTYLDLLGIMPIDKCFNLIGLVGVGKMEIKEAGDDAAKGDTHFTKVGFRLGAGVSYSFDDNWGVRALATYQKLGNKDGAEHKMLKQAYGLSVGVTYTL